MKTLSIQSKFLMTIILAMVAIAVFVGGLCIYEVDRHVHKSAEEMVATTCESETSQINDVFGGMEKSVRIMKSYMLDFIETKADALDKNRQKEITTKASDIFADVAKNTKGTVAYYLRFDPAISDSTSGLFYSKVGVNDIFTRLEVTDLSAYDKNDTEHVGWFWQPYEAGEPVWMEPYYNKNNDIFMISYVIPVYFEDLFVGIVGMDFDYTVLTNRIDNIKIYDNGYAHLEQKGKIAYHKELEVGTEAPDMSDEYMQESRKLNNGMTLVLSANYDDLKHIRYNIEFKIIYVVVALTIIFAVIAIFIVSKIVKPLREITAAAEKLSAGDFDVKITHSKTEEIVLLSTAFEKMIMSLREHEKHQHLLAYRDSLTGLRNTTAYKAWVTDFEKEKEPEIGIVVLDINYLKETNDKYGHDIGNKLIIAVAQVISGIFKRSPVFRIGGDEFLVILKSRDFSERELLLKKLEEECNEKTISADDTQIPISVAKGVAVFDPDTDKSFSDLFNRADDTMYENKRKMKGRYSHGKETKKICR